MPLSSPITDAAYSAASCLCVHMLWRHAARRSHFAPPPNLLLLLLQVRANLITAQPYQDTFGTVSKRKKPRLTVDSLSELATRADELEEK